MSQGEGLPIFFTSRKGRGRGCPLLRARRAPWLRPFLVLASSFGDFLAETGFFETDLGFFEFGGQAADL